MIKLNQENLRSGIKVLMPSSFEATLQVTPNNVIVQYDENYSVSYSKEQFNKLMSEGITLLETLRTEPEEDLTDEEYLDSAEYLYSLLINGNLDLYKEKLNKLTPADLDSYKNWADSIGLSEEDLKLAKYLNENMMDVIEDTADLLPTDVQDVDMPQAIADSIPTTEDGEVITLEKIWDVLNKLVADVQALKQLPTQPAEPEQPEEPELPPVEEVDDEEDEEEEVEEKDEPEESDKEEDSEDMDEDLNKTKRMIDRLTQQNKEPREIKNAITLMSDDENEEEQASEDAITKMKESLLNTRHTAKLRGLIVG